MSQSRILQSCIREAVHISYDTCLMHLDHCRWIFLSEFQSDDLMLLWVHVSLYFHILCSVAIAVRHTWLNLSHSLSYWPWWVQIVVILSDWATVAITHFHQAAIVASWSGLWCLIHGHSYPYERTIRWTERHHGLVVAVICGRRNKEAMFFCKKVRHIAYYEPSVYLAWFVECARYMSFAILLTDSQGLRRIPTFKPFR